MIHQAAKPAASTTGRMTSFASAGDRAGGNGDSTSASSSSSSGAPRACSPSSTPGAVFVSTTILYLDGAPKKESVTLAPLYRGGAVVVDHLPFACDFNVNPSRAAVHELLH